MEQSYETAQQAYPEGTSREGSSCWMTFRSALTGKSQGVLLRRSPRLAQVLRLQESWVWGPGMPLHREAYAREAWVLELESTLPHVNREISDR